MDAPEEQVTDREIDAAIRKQARRVWAQSIATALVFTAALYLLPL